MKPKTHLQISEKFYSIQGEGKTIGVPAVFIRLGGCNLLCKSDSWICDSIEVWKKSNKVNFEDVLTVEMINALQNGAHLVFTGGEPMLHQNSIFEFIQWYHSVYEKIPFVEIETNGTIVPNYGLIHFVNQWNVSPKLSNSGETLERRFNPSALGQLGATKRAIFKFVVSEEKDIEEIFDYIDYIDRKNIYLMPAGEDQELLNSKRLLVVEMCKKYGFNYSERLHIIIWNEKTGV